jgi:hypothetical protein
LIECGPGKVLLGLNKRINKRMAADAIFSADTVNKTLAKIREEQA